MRTIHIMCGLPASGKSTFADLHGQNDIVIHRDKVREQLRIMLKSNETFPTGNWVEYDFFINWVVTAINATNGDIWIDQTTLNAGALNKLLHALNKRIQNLDNFNFVIEKIDTPIEVCIERDSHRTGFERVTESVIRSMNNGFTLSAQSIASMNLPERKKLSISIRHHGGNK